MRFKNIREIACTCPEFWYEYIKLIKDGKEIIFDDGTTIDHENPFSIKKVNKLLLDSNPYRKIDDTLEKAIIDDLKNGITAEKITRKYSIAVRRVSQIYETLTNKK